MQPEELYIITVYKNVLKDKVVNSFTCFLSALLKDEPFEKTVKLYSEFTYNLYNNTDNLDLTEHIKKLIYKDENILSKNADKIIQFDENESYNTNLVLKTAPYELDLFEDLFSYDYSRIKELLLEKYPNYRNVIEPLPQYYMNKEYRFYLNDIINSYRTNGYGIFAENTAFKYTQDKEIQPVNNFNPMSFCELKNYKYQQEVILNNTKAFLEGKDANNILLYGDRGCGKSSTVKALVKEFKHYNLKIVQITKESFIYLSDLYDKLRNLPNKFIIFADDISFDENDKNFSTIKAILEGSLTDKPSNTIMYATTNRMHLVKESFSAREGNELHLNDTIDETVSLSDRFGIMLTFSSLTKNEYLDIVSQIAKDFNVSADEKLYREAEMFASLKAIRTPRVARQFITDYIANM